MKFCSVSPPQKSILIFFSTVSNCPVNIEQPTHETAVIRTKTLNVGTDFLVDPNCLTEMLT